MATFVQRGSRWQAQVAVDGVRRSKTFDLKSEAKRWAAEAEITLRKGDDTSRSKTLRQALEKYRDEVSIHKKGERWETVRLNLFIRTMENRKIDGKLTTYLAEWRDKRVTEVAPSSVRREMNLLASVLEQARREWKWCSVNPVRDVRKPGSPPPRRRGIAQDEIDKLVGALGYSDDLVVTMKQQEVAVAFLIAIETAMRAGEILGAQYDLEKRVARLEKTKNGDRREVPLSSRAVFLKKKVPAWTIDSASLDALFRAAKKKVGVEGLTFHDSRSEGITRLAKKLDVMQLARAIGHRDPKSLMFYFAESAESIAAKLG